MNISPLPRLTRRRAARLFAEREPGRGRRVLSADDTGAATAEYAIATMATVAGLWQRSRCRRHALR